MASVMRGGFGGANDQSNGTEFISQLKPRKGELSGYDNTKPCSEQSASIPQIFCDAMSVREAVFGQQGVPLEAEFDEDDERSWHWVIYASVASTSLSTSKQPEAESNTEADDRRRASASAVRLPVGTIRLIPPPHGPNKYLEVDRHPDAEPREPVYSEVVKNHPKEPYIKFGRLAVLKEYRGMGLSKTLLSHALGFAARHPDTIRPPPSPTTLEHVNQLGTDSGELGIWQGLAMVHSQAGVKKLWERHGFSEELIKEDGSVEISKEPSWFEEGIEHVALWKRLKLDKRL